MNIEEACRVVRAWSDILSPDARPGSAPGSLTDAVAELKRYLGLDVAEGPTSQELELSQTLLMTRAGVRGVMPFVLSAESRIGRAVAE